MMRWFLSFLAAGALTPAALGQYAITTIAGGGPPNGVAATSVALSDVYGIAVDSSGNLYVPSRAQNRVYKVATNGAITTVAGTGLSGYSGDNGPATAAQLNSPYGVALDSAGNLYIADQGNYRIRKVSGGVITTVAGDGNCCYGGDFGPAANAQTTAYGVAVDGAGNFYIADGTRVRKVSGGVITTAAGLGSYGYSGDGGPATSALLTNPYSLAVDGAGNLYIADQGNARIRKVSGGVITTVAGTGTFGYSGDGGPATSAQIGNAFGVAVDSAGSLYISESSRIRKVSAGVITTVAGNGTFGFSGDGGPATSAQISYAFGVAVDSAGNLYIADHRNYRVRKVSGGVINTVAGNGSFEFSGDNGPATTAQIDPGGVAVDSAGNLYISDFRDYRVRKVSGGAISTFAGNGIAGYSGDNGPPTSAQISSVTGVAADGAGNLYLADSGNSRIRKISSGVITTVAGNGTFGYSGDGGLATSAQLSSIQGIAVDSSGAIYITDPINHRVRKVSGGVITLVAGGGPQDGASATSVSVMAVNTAVDSAGNVYVASAGQHRVYKVATNGSISTVAGNGTAGYSGDNGLATGAQLAEPYSVTVDSAGNLYIADSLNSRIRKVSGGLISTVAGGGFGCPQQTSAVGDGCPPTSGFLRFPRGIAVDSGGSLYIADSGNFLIRKVSGGVITTVAGSAGNSGYSGDGGSATSAQISSVAGVAVDSGGNLYIADTYNSRIRKVSSGLITTVAGNGTYGYSGDGGAATTAQISFAQGIAVDSTGNLYIADTDNHRIRKVSGGVISTVAGNGMNGYSGDNVPATDTKISSPQGIAVDSTGNLYIAGTTSSLIRKVSGGLISTIAGNGSYSFSGDGGQATNAQLWSPSYLALDSAGNLYISDTGNGRVRVVSSGGTISTFAGGGTQMPGDGGPATNALLFPNALAVDGGSNVYIADRVNKRLRKVSGGVISTITTLAGQGSYPFGSDGGVAVDSAANIYVSEPVDGRVRLLTPVSVSSISPVSVLAGASGVTLTVNGANFANGDIVLWNGAALITTFESSAKLTAAVGSSQIAQPVSVCVQVMTSGGLTSCVTFTVLSSATIPSTVALASSANPSAFGQAVTLTATVSPAPATGSVTFYDGITVLGIRTLAAGQAALTTTLLSSGVRSLKAYYGGNSTYFPSSSVAIAQTVNPVPQGGFAPAGTYGVEGLSVSIVGGDFNRDGITDLAVANLSSNSVSVLLGNGNGSFQVAVNYAADNSPSWVTSGDFNGDGKTDLAVTNAVSNNVSVLLGNGDGSFQSAVNHAVGNTPNAVAVGDFNGDGRADLAVTTGPCCPPGINNNVSILLGNGNGSFQLPVNYIVGNGPLSVAVEDFNRDGKADLVVANYSNGSVSVLLGNGNGTFQAATNYGVGFNPERVATGDFNADGNPDLVVSEWTSASVSVLLGNGNGSFQAAVHYATGHNPNSVAVIDFNGDGKSDLAVANFSSNNVSVLQGNGNGTFQAAVNYGVGFAPFGMAAGDFNGDGRIDLATANRFGPNVSILLGVSGSGIRSDFNANGRPDVIWQDPVSGMAQVWFLGGAQGTTVTGAVNLTASNTWRIVGVSDFNQDGRPDVVWQDPASGAAQVWFLGGAQGNVVTGAAVLSFGNAWRIRSIADFDRDGKPDLIWQDPVTGTAQIWFLGGALGNIVTGAVNLTAGNSWRIVGTGDFNGDTRPDVLWQDPVSGAAQVWYLGGAQGNVVTSAVNLTTSNSWRIAAVGDFSGDGRPDVVWQDPASGASQVWFLGGQPGTTITGVANLSGPNSWRIAGPR